MNVQSMALVKRFPTYKACCFLLTDASAEEKIFRPRTGESEPREIQRADQENSVLD